MNRKTIAAATTTNQYTVAIPVISWHRAYRHFWQCSIENAWLYSSFLIPFHSHSTFIQFIGTRTNHFFFLFGWFIIKSKNPMKNNNGIFIRAEWCDLKILLLVVFQQWLSSSYLTAHQAAHRIFSQKQSSSESRVCIIFLLLSLIHCYCYFSSNFFLSPSLPCSERCCCCFVCVALHSIPLFTHPTSAQRSYLFWTPASMPEIAIVFWYLFFFFSFILSLMPVYFRFHLFEAL